MGLVRVLFLGLSDVQAPGLTWFSLRPMVIPALLQLQHAGFQLVLHAVVEAKGQSAFAALLEMLEGQGVRFSHTFVAAPDDDAFSRLRRPNIAAIREALHGSEIDRNRSLVLGQGRIDEAFAANLGVALRPLAFPVDAWPNLAKALISQPRTAAVARRTSETNIDVAVNLDGDPAATQIATGIGFFDHMLAQLARHGGMQLTIKVEGDLHIDEHHTVEDTALALGQALRLALGDRFGIERYAFVLPMDETEARVSIDLSGRPHLTFTGTFPRGEVGGLPTELVPHFFRSLAEAMGATLHIEVLGDNAHHMVEGIFKSVARCLKQATRQSGEAAIPSTKGVL